MSRPPQAQQRCEGCQSLFGEYYCGVCHLFDRDKKQYHCDDCGICRCETRRRAAPLGIGCSARLGSGRGGGQLLLLLTRRSSLQDRPEGGFLPLLKMQLVSEPQPPREAQGGRGGLCLPLGNSAVSLTEAGCLGSAPAHAGGTLKPCSKCTKQHASGLASPTAEGKHP